MSCLLLILINDEYVLKIKDISHFTSEHTISPTIYPKKMDYKPYVYVCIEITIGFHNIYQSSK